MIVTTIKEYMGYRNNGFHKKLGTQINSSPLENIVATIFTLSLKLKPMSIIPKMRTRYIRGENNPIIKKNRQDSWQFLGMAKVKHK